MYKNDILQDLREYYDFFGGGDLLVGMNGSQAIRVLRQLSEDLNRKDSVMIDASSLTMNKTEHIDYFLDANLSLEEIKLSQIYSAVSAIEHVMEESHLPVSLGQIGQLSRLFYKVKENDKNIYIRDAIEKAIDPIIVYSCGENNLMREVGNNPGSIMKDYKRKAITPNFDYTVAKAKSPKSLQRVLDGIERNFNHILSLNASSDIYALGTYVPKQLEAEELKVFKDLILRYNDELKALCSEYGCSFVTTEKVGSSFLTDDRFFHPTEKGSNYIEENILMAMYKRKIENPIFVGKDAYYTEKYSILNEKSGAAYVEDACLIDAGRTHLDSKIMSGYAQKRKLDEVHEHVRESKIFQKIRER